MSENIICIAERLLQQSKNVLCTALPSLIRGLNKLEYSFVDSGNTYTDGSTFFCNAHALCYGFYNDSCYVNHLLLHALLHCMFFHPFNTEFKDEKLWSLACDIAVEHTINEWKIPCTESQKSGVRKQHLDILSKNLKHFTAENIYYYLMSEDNNDIRLNDLSDIFNDDDHTAWYSRRKLSLADTDVESTEIHSIYKQSDSSSGKTTSSKDKAFTDIVNSSDSEKCDEWRKISAQVVADLSSRWGASAGVDVQLLKNISKKGYDYSAVLKRFLAVNEALEINDDEFDYIFYTYGLKLYNNMPIIEPLEYIENNKIKKLFIAIDTSGSVKGDIVQGFMNKTYDILKQTDYFSSRCEIHILQCDSTIQDVAIIHNIGELEHYISTASLKGFGGTDFNPVFEYVSDECADSQGQGVNGLIYFTDGDGVYPSQSPGFKSLFVIHDNGFDKSKVPLWGTVLYIDKIGLIR